MKSKEIYEARYSKGYMEYWDQQKLNKVVEFFNSIELPKIGKILDFGCGNGIFTNLIKTILPQWEVYGSDLSETAIENAKVKFKQCFFLNASELKNNKKSFDVIFTHHVLEHVDDIKKSIDDFDFLLKEEAFQIHILPCGNKNSFEHKICTLKNNGIELEKQNRFFFEEPGHLRRLTSNDLVSDLKKYNFQLELSFFSNQHDGAINWISKSSPRFVKMLTSQADAKDNGARLKLKKLRMKLLPITYLQFPYTKYLQHSTKWKKNSKDYLIMLVLLFPSLISRMVYWYYDHKSLKEWTNHKTDEDGSEMFLFFKRSI